MRILTCITILLVSVSVFASRNFNRNASQDMACTDGNLGNWDFTQAWTVSAWVFMSTNSALNIIEKQDVTTLKGWKVFCRVGAATPTIAVEVRNSSALRATCFTTTEQTTNAWHSVVATYSGSGTVAGVTIYVDGVNQALSTVSDTLGGNTIISTNVLDIGGSPANQSPFAGFLRRVLIYNSVLAGANLTAVQNGASVPQAGLQVWQECERYDGTVNLSDWSPNIHTFTNNGTIYTTTDPTITNLPPPFRLQ